jgi:hypothetical protein
MSDTARRLREQKAFSTDPAWLERNAREEEACEVDPVRRDAPQSKSPRPMPLRWTIDPEFNFVGVVAVGDVTRLDAEEMLEAMASRGAMTYRKLFDGTEGTTTMAPEDLRALGVRMRAYHAQGPMGALALILPPEKAEVVLPILGMLAAADRPMRIFRDRQRARRWLSSLGTTLPRLLDLPGEIKALREWIA